MKKTSVNECGKYDIIIAGAGCAGLSLAYQLVQAGVKKSILLVDRRISYGQDKTWCFWDDAANSDTFWTDWSWSSLGVYTARFCKEEELKGQRYFMLRSETFYRQILEILRKSTNVNVIEADIERVYADDTKAYLEADGITYIGNHLFNSIPQRQSVMNNGSLLKQHFRGWRIKSELPVFNKETVRMMDFRTEQFEDVRFFYVLPFSEHEALVEYTVFSNKVLQQSEYDEAIRAYINDNLRIPAYHICEYEQGVIPMYPVSNEGGHERIIPIGTAAGAVKPTTGYAFKRIQDHIRQIVSSMLAGKDPGIKIKTGVRFRYYDRLLLHILNGNSRSKHLIFDQLFYRNDISLILKFLSEKTNLLEEVLIFSSLPIRLFLSAALDLAVSSVHNGIKNIYCPPRHVQTVPDLLHAQHHPAAGRPVVHRHLPD